MKRIGFIFGVACLWLGVGFVFSQPQPGSPWPMFQHDPYHTGRSPYNGPETSTLKWTFVTGDNSNGILRTPVIAEDSTIYISSMDGYVYSLNPDGSEKWRSFLAEGENHLLIGADGTLYCTGDYNTSLYAINPNGSVKWRYEFVYFIWGIPSLGSDGTIYLGIGETLYAFNPDSTLKWTYSTGRGEIIYGLPTIGPDGTIYFTAEDNYLYALTSTGSLRWDYFIEAGTYWSMTSFSAEESTLYCGSVDSLYAFNPDRTRKWTFPTEGLIFSAPAIGEDGTIYFGSYDSTFYALYPDGNLKWSFPAAGAIHSSAVIDSDGTIYFGDGGYPPGSTGIIYALNPNGSLLWSYELPGEITGSPAIGADGTLYIGCRNGVLYAFGTPIPGVEERESASGGQVFSYQLLQNRPNPFLTSGKATNIRYGSAKPGKVSLKIYDITGRLVQTLVEGEKKAGVYSILWDGRDPDGKKVASGIYFYRLQSGNFISTKKLILLR